MGYSEGVYDLVRAFRDPEQSLSYRFYEKDFYARWFKDPERYPVEVLREVKLGLVAWIQDKDSKRSNPKYWVLYVLIEGQ